MANCLPQATDVTSSHDMPREGFVRLRDFVGRGNAFPVSRSSYHSGVKAGKYPAPMHIGKVAVLPVEVARDLIERMGSAK